MKPFSNHSLNFSRNLHRITNPNADCTCTCHTHTTPLFTQQDLQNAIIQSSPPLWILINPEIRTCSRICPCPVSRPPLCTTSMIHFDQVAPEVMQAMCTPMHQVLSPAPVAGHPPTGALYIGSFIAAQDKDMLREHDITHLVQVLNVPWLPAYDKEGFNTYHIGIDDATSADIRPYLEAACNYIDSALRSGRNCLVHCQQVRQMLIATGLQLIPEWSRVYHVVQLSSLHTSFAIVI